jgi:hypothetical protein
MKSLPGVVALGVFVYILAHSQRPAPRIGHDTPPAEFESPRFHGRRQPGMVDRTIDVSLRGPDGSPVSGRLLQAGNRFYVESDGRRLEARVTNDYYFYSPGLDLGTIAGFRGGARGSDGDTFAVGVRASPARIFYGTVAPDIVLTQDWIGLGASAYLPANVVGDAWSHVGAGAWYGYPTRGESYGDPGWVVGISLSIR